MQLINDDDDVLSTLCDIKKTQTRVEMQDHELPMLMT